MKRRREDTIQSSSSSSESSSKRFLSHNSRGNAMHENERFASKELEKMRATLYECQKLMERTRREAKFDAERAVLGEIQRREMEIARLRQLLSNLKTNLLNMKSFIERLPLEGEGQQQRKVMYSRDFNSIGERFNHLLRMLH